MSPERQPGPARSGHPEHLFAPLTAEAEKALQNLPGLLRRAFPLRPAMERELPNRIRDLSLSLTADREGGPRPGYLSDPRELAAYAWYFLPWNLLRLCRLLPGLDLTLPEDGLVCDLGTGPLTLPLALWLSRPDLRRTRLRFVCTDRSRRALDLGVRLFTEVAGFDPTSRDAPWRMRCLRGEYWQGLVEGAHLLAMVNVANEMVGTHREPLADRMERLAGQLAGALAAEGRVLVIEPGTRLGWRCLEGMRRAFVEMGLGLTAPCPHERPCPLAEGRGRAWCHCILSPRGAPAWLTSLSERAGLAKERLSLSFLLVRAGAAPAASGLARVVSGPFALTDVRGSAVYACSGAGLLVLVAPDGRPPRSGDLVPVVIPADAPVDAKTGAPRVTLPSGPGLPVRRDGEGSPPRPPVARKASASRPGAGGPTGRSAKRTPVSPAGRPPGRKRSRPGGVKGGLPPGRKGSRPA